MQREKKLVIVNGVALNSAVSSLQYWKLSMEGARMQGKGRGWGLPVTAKQTMGLSQWLSNVTALTLCDCWNLLEIEMNFCRMNFLFFHLCTLSLSLPISIYQFWYLEHVSADRSLQPTSRCTLQWIVVMERPGLRRENYDQQSIAIDAHTHTKSATRAHKASITLMRLSLHLFLINFQGHTHTFFILSSLSLCLFLQTWKHRIKKKKESYQ